MSGSNRKVILSRSRIPVICEGAPKKLPVAMLLSGPNNAEGLFKRAIRYALAAALAAFSAAAAQLAAPPDQEKDKPFMLFVTPLLPPEGRERSEAFSKACFKELKEFFDTTSLQVILVPTVEKADSMSNQKKDIILTTDTLDRYIKGSQFDTLVIWIRYHVGLLHSRIDIPYLKGREATLPPLIARKVYLTIRNEFTGVVELEGGPPGMTITLTQGVVVKPPRTMLFPPGDYYLTSQYPDFKTRIDTLVVFQGRVTKKRILLLP